MLKIAVIDGAHPYDVPGWHRLFRSMEGIEYYPQSLDNWVWDWGQCRAIYDVALFYNFHFDLPADPEDATRKSIQWLGTTQQGIVVLHHAILAWPGEKIWSDITGIADRAFEYHVDQTYTVQVTAPDHPIVSGLQPWNMRDETYTMQEPDENCEQLLTTEHPRSMKSIAWTRTYGRSRVFCFQAGHDQIAWSSGHFREVLRRGILWAAGRL